MNFDWAKDYKFYVKVSYVILLSSIVTLLITQFLKWILKKKKVITSEMNESRKDLLLSRIGRVVALITYSIFFFINELYLKHEIHFDESLIIGLFIGACLTLQETKALYTTLHQFIKKEGVFKEIEENEKKFQNQLDEQIANNETKVWTLRKK